MKVVVETDELIQRLHHWDEEALAEVYDTWAPLIYRYAYRLIGDSDTAQDVVADTFQRLLTALKKGNGPGRNISAWLFRVAHNRVVDLYRKNSHHQIVPLDELNLSQIETAENTYVKLERTRQVRTALWKLTDDQRRVILLRFLEGLGIEDVARILDKPAGAVKSLQHRALSTLKRNLEEEYARTEHKLG